MSLALAGARLARSARCAFDLARDARALRSTQDLRRAQMTRLQRVCASMIDALGVVVRTSGKVPSGQVLLVSNHLSYLDPLILGAAVPCIPLAKQEVGSWPIVGPLARELGTVFVNRDDAFGRARALRRARRLLAEGATVLNFPEGSTTRGDLVLPFRRGLFGVAIELGIPVVPARIDFPDPSLAWVDDETFVPHFFGLLRRPCAPAYVRFGAPIATRPGDDAQALADRARRTIAEMDAMRPTLRGAA